MYVCKILPIFGKVIIDSFRENWKNSAESDDISLIVSKVIVPWRIPNGIKNALASGAATGIVKALLQPFGFK